MGLRKTLDPILDPGGYEVELILAHREGPKGTDYLVQWKGCSYLQSTWEPESSLSSAQTALARYARKARQVNMSSDAEV